MKPLSKATAGDSYKIGWLMGLPEAVSFLRKSDVCEGSILHVISNYAGSVLIRCGNRRFMLDQEVAERIRVSPCL